MNKVNVLRLSAANKLLTELTLMFSSTYKIGMIDTVLCRWFRICSDLALSHSELVKLMDVFKNSGYPKNFINNYLKTLLNKKFKIQERVEIQVTAPKKPLFLVLLTLDYYHYKLEPN